jgi:hypothetical protein
MPPARVKRRPWGQPQQGIAPLPTGALPLAQALLLAAALVGQGEAACQQRLLAEGTGGIGLAPVREQRTLEFPPQHIPAHKQLEAGLTAPLPIPTALPPLRQLVGQRDVRPIFHDHRRKALEQRQGNRFDLHPHLSESLQHLIEKLAGWLRKALTQSTGRELHLPSPGDLRQAIERDVRLTQPARDQRLGKIRSAEDPLALNKSAFLRQHVGVCFQDLSQGLAHICSTGHGSSIMSTTSMVFLHDGTRSPLLSSFFLLT